MPIFSGSRLFLVPRGTYKNDSCAASSPQISHYVVDQRELQTALALAHDEVRAAVAWQFARFFSGERDSSEGSGKSLWTKIGPAFFSHIWPLEPTLQSPKSANDFARIPALVGVDSFKDSVETIVPSLRPFDLWDAKVWLGLGTHESDIDMVQGYPIEALTLLDSCTSDESSHKVLNLRPLVDAIVSSRPALSADHRVRKLRRLSAD